MTLEFCPTTSAAVSPGHQTTTSLVTRPQQALGQGQSLSLFFFAPSPQFLTQGQPDKAKYAPQTNHIRCPMSSQLTFTFLCRNSTITAHLKFFIRPPPPLPRCHCAHSPAGFQSLTKACDGGDSLAQEALSSYLSRSLFPHYICCKFFSHLVLFAFFMVL